MKKVLPIYVTWTGSTPKPITLDEYSGIVRTQQYMGRDVREIHETANGIQVELRPPNDYDGGDWIYQLFFKQSYNLLE